MNKVKFIEICTMRADGYTYQEIADALGCTKQNVHEILKNTLRENGRRMPSNFVYRNLGREILNTYGGVPSLCEATGLKYRRTYDMITGRVRVTLDEAIFFSDLFSKDIRYLFERKETEK